MIVADCGYGDAAEFRHGLTERQLAYVVQVSGRLTAYPASTNRTTAEYAGVGSYPQPRYQQPAPTLTELITTGTATARRVTWRPGSRRRGGRPTRCPRSSYSPASAQPGGPYAPPTAAKTYPKPG